MSKISCPSCQMVNPSKAMFCMSCGASLALVMGAHGSTSKPASRRSHLFGMFVISLGAVACWEAVKMAPVAMGDKGDYTQIMEAVKISPETMNSIREFPEVVMSIMSGSAYSSGATTD
jgi:hypothetical protein